MSAGGELLNDIASTRIPIEVAHPHGRNAFAVADGIATHDSYYGKQAASADVEATANRSGSSVQQDQHPTPTAEELASLRKISGSIPKTAYLLCVVEFAERASYYGASSVFVNFMQFPLPHGGNGAGAPARGTEDTAGALGKGLQFANAISLLFLFLAYIIPIFGGWLGDAKLGKYNAILLGVLLCGLAHVVMICGAIPSVLQAGNGMAPFMISLLLLAVGAGLFKPNVVPTVLDQYMHQRPYVRTLASGERVVVDPETTINSIMLIFYAVVNIGAFFALATTYSEKYVGYWLAYLLPGILYFLLPVLLWFLNDKLVKSPPDSSALNKVWKIGTVALKHSKGAFWKETFWDAAKPSVLAQRGITTFMSKPISWTDRDCDEIRRTMTACAIFLYFPIYDLNDGGIGAVSNSQGSTLTTQGTPNDLLNSFNALTIIVTIPILSYVVYPALQKYRIKFGRISRMTFGFSLAVLSGISGTLVQYYVYKTSPCGYYATGCDGVSPISIWVQIPNVALGAASECFANVTAYELAYARSPPGMKSLVTALFLATLALSYALSEILTPVITDPYLIWVWAGPTIALAVQTVIFWVRYRKYNDDEFMLEVEETRGSSHAVSEAGGSDTLTSSEK